MTFEEELKKALSGEVYNKFGFDSDPFTPIPKKKIESFVNRKNELNQLARAIAHLTKGELLHIPILGAHGIGKTHFLYYVYSGVSRAKQDLDIEKVIFIEGVQQFKELLNCAENTPEFDLQNCKFIKNLGKDTSEVLIFIDDLDIIFNRLPKVVSDLMGTFKGGIIGTWDPRAWDVAKRVPYAKIPKTEVIYLPPLSLLNSKKILIKRISHSKISSVCDEIFPDFIIEKLAIIGDGNPYKLITMAKRYFNFVINENITKVNEDIFSKFSERIGVTFITDLKKRINKLTERQKEVLRYVIDKIEVNANDLAEYIGTSRVAAVQHLHSLRELDLLESKPKGRSIYFYVPNVIVDDVDAFLQKDFEKEGEIPKDTER